MPLFFQSLVALVFLASGARFPGLCIKPFPLPASHPACGFYVFGFLRPRYVRLPMLLCWHKDMEVELGFCNSLITTAGAQNSSVLKNNRLAGNALNRRGFCQSAGGREAAPRREKKRLGWPKKSRNSFPLPGPRGLRCAARFAVGPSIAPISLD